MKDGLKFVAINVARLLIFTINVETQQNLCFGTLDKTDITQDNALTFAKSVLLNFWKCTINF